MTWGPYIVTFTRQFWTCLWYPNPQYTIRSLPLVSFRDKGMQIVGPANPRRSIIEWKTFTRWLWICPWSSIADKNNDNIFSLPGGDRNLSSFPLIVIDYWWNNLVLTVVNLLQWSVTDFIWNLQIKSSLYKIIQVQEKQIIDLGGRPLVAIKNCII